MMTKRRDPRKFVLSNEKHLPALTRWVKGHHANTYNELNTPENIITIGHDTKPDSDWGRYELRGRVIVTNPELIKAVRACVREAVGWPPKEEASNA
jgi:hypothetical protein